MEKQLFQRICDSDLLDKFVQIQIFGRDKILPVTPLAFVYLEPRDLRNTKHLAICMPPEFQLTQLYGWAGSRNTFKELWKGPLQSCHQDDLEYVSSENIVQLMKERNRQREKEDLGEVNGRLCPTFLKTQLPRGLLYSLPGGSIFFLLLLWQ